MASKKIERTHLREAYGLTRERHVTDTLKRAAFVSTVVTVTIAVLGLVVVSPLALRQFGSLQGLNWTKLSNIGQTYGAASALLTGLALIGVAGSMIFQVRAINVSRAQSVREQHTHLVEMSLADPVYMLAWGDDPEEVGGPDVFRQLAFVNLFCRSGKMTLGSVTIQSTLCVQILQTCFEVSLRGNTGPVTARYGYESHNVVATGGSVL